MSGDYNTEILTKTEIQNTYYYFKSTIDEERDKENLIRVEGYFDVNDVYDFDAITAKEEEKGRSYDFDAIREHLGDELLKSEEYEVHRTIMDELLDYCDHDEICGLTTLFMEHALGKGTGVKNIHLRCKFLAAYYLYQNSEWYTF